MSDIRIYDFEFKLLKVCSDYISSNWSIYFNDIGTFEAHFPMENDVAKVLFSNEYLVAVQEEKAAIITGKQVVNDIAVYGRTPNWLLSKRVSLPFAEMTGTVEEMTRSVISEAFSDIVGKEGGISWGKPVGLTSTFSLTRTDAKSTFDVVKECLLKNNAGHRLSFEPTPKKWVYTVLKGEELPLVVSEDNLNAHDTQYTCDCMDYCSGGWYQEKQEADAQGNTAEPIWKRIDKDSTKKGIYRWDCILSGNAESEASDGLNEKTQKKQMITQTRNLLRGRDYELGDIVTARVIKGALEVTEKKRIIGVSLWYEYGDTGEEPIFEEE